MSTYWSRINPEMDAKKMEIQGLADALGVSFQAVVKVRDGGALGSKNNFKAANLFGVNPEWLATGKGQKHKAEVVHQAVTRKPRGDVIAIPVLSNVASMGFGSDDQDGDVVVGDLALSPKWVSDTLHPSKPTNMRFIHGYGDSMTPTFNSGDVLLVDTGISDARIDGIYVLKAHDRLFIKRVRQRLDGSYEISSDNPVHKTVDTLNGGHDVSILGRVLWAWNGKKL